MTEPTRAWRSWAIEVLAGRERGRVRMETAGREELAPRDRAAALDAVQGVRRNTYLLDAVLRRFLSKPLRQVPPRLRDVLRLGVYELLFKSRAPAAGVVTAAVDLAGREKRFRGLVNAVLRKVAGSMEPIERKARDCPRSRSEVWVGEGRAIRFSVPVLPDPEQDLVGWLSHQYTLTRLFVEALLVLLPLEYEELFRALNTPRPLALRPTRHCGGLDALAARLEAEGARVLARREPILEVRLEGGVASLPSLRDGLAVVQDRTPAEVAPFLAPRARERVLDLCAAPGGKTVHLAELMDDEGEVVATDGDPARLERVRESVARLGLTCVHVVPSERDGSGVPPGPFDRVLVDAPCTNTGVLMRKVEARYRVDEAHLARLEALQLELLERGARRLGEGGVLVYATCSIIPGENQLLVRRFLEGNPGFRLEEERLRYPQRTLRDGGYMARIRAGGGTMDSAGR